jgi:hypothetical protein
MGAGSSFNYYSPPPVQINADLGSWNFIKENSWWPMVHSAAPATIYFFTRDFFFTIFLTYLNETVEVLVLAISGRHDAAETTYWSEWTLDSLFGDILMGVFGIWIAELLMQCCHWKYTMLPTNIYRNQKRIPYILKYYFQMLCLLASLEGNLFTYGYGQFSYGITIGFILYPLLLWLFTFWNKDDPLWERHFDRFRKIKGKKNHWTLRDGYYATVTQSQVKEKRNRFLKAWAAFYVIFTGLQFYRWTYNILINTGLCILTIIILYIIRNETVSFRYFYVDNNPSIRKK